MLCSVCFKNEVTNEGGIDYCLDCHFSGRRFETFLLSPERSNMLARIREIEGVSTASIWHVGSGRFNLGVILRDGTIVSPGVAVEVGEMITVQPAVPPLGQPWAMMIARSVGDGSMVAASILQETFDDDGVVEEVERIATGEREIDFEVEEEEELSLDDMLSEAVEEAVDSTWITGTGQFIQRTHSPEKCEGEGCVVHHPSDHPMKEWPTKMVGVSMLPIPQHSERVCEHGIGHPDPDDITFFGKQGIDITIGHSEECDGCCSIGEQPLPGA